MKISLSNLFLLVALIALSIAHYQSRTELIELRKLVLKDSIYEIVENGPNNGGGGSDIAILIAAESPEIAFEHSKKFGFTSPWTIYEIGKCSGDQSRSPLFLRGPYLVNAALNSRAWKSYHADLGDPPVFRPDIYPEEEDE